MSDTREMTDKEKDEFFKQIPAARPSFPISDEKSTPVMEKKLSTYKPIFGEYFKERMVASLEGSVYDPEKTYKVIEQETVAYIADIIKDFGFSIIAKIRGNRF